MQYFIIPLLMAFICCISAIFIRCFLNLLYRSRVSVCFFCNYQGKHIPAIGGAVYLPVLLASLVLSTALYPKSSLHFSEFLSIAGVVGFTGLLDDLIGDKGIKGIRQHIRSTLKGNLTTGFVKAFMTGLTSFNVSIRISDTLMEMLVNLSLMLLFTNLLNLLDLRPGRTVKVFFFFSLPLLYFLTIHDRIVSLPFIIMILASIVYFPFDLKEICMLGDTGSNILGITLGYYYALLAPFPLKAALLVFLIGIHIAAEKISLSKLIEKHKLLAYFDNLGRSTTSDDEYQPRHC